MNINDSFRYLNIGLPEDILRRKLYGDFEGAVRLIDRRLARDDTPKGLRACLTAQREMILRTPADYPYTRETALARLRNYIPDFTEEEFDERVDAGKIGWIYIDGEMRFFARFFESMCKVEPAFAVRAGVQTAGVEASGQQKNHLDRVMEIMREKGSMACRIRIRATVKLKDEHFTAGMLLRAHLIRPALRGTFPSRGRRQG